MKDYTGKISIHSRICFVILAMFLGSAILHAELARVGPINATNGFPFWYQDKAAVAMDFCLPNATELQAGTCLLFPADVPDSTQAISFPGNFPMEAFWWNATANMNVNGGKALMLMALEASFVNGEVVAGDQIAFARVRIRAATPGPGTYKVIYPFGEKTFQVTSGGSKAIDFTTDLGLVPGNFALALAGPIGPFLMASTSPGGAPLPFVVLPGGNTYLTDPNVLTSITGSPFNTNYFRIEGPNIGGAGIPFAQTDQFTLLGRVHLGPIGDALAVERATYARDNSKAWIDVFATVTSGVGTTPPILSFSGAGIPGRIMISEGQHFHGQSIPADPNVLPPMILVTNNSDNPPSTIETGLTDLVTITQATYNGGALRIEADSSDSLVPPLLSVLEYGPMTNGVLVVPNLPVPPPEVTVVSSAGGSSTMAVSTVQEQVSGPIVVGDAATTDSGQPVMIDVMANDPSSNVVLRILGNPAHGTMAFVPCAAPSTSPTCIQYSPKLYYFGADQFTYVTKDASNLDSNVATVAITVNFVNHNPVANNDAVSVGKNASIAIDVLANDVDPDGNGTLNPGSVTIINPPTAGSASVNLGTGKITYTAPNLEGTFSLTYVVSDTSIPVLTSNVATVTVTVFQLDTVDVAKATFKTSKNQWTVSGTTLIPGPNNTVTVHVGPTLAGAIIGSIASDATGAWKLVVKKSTIPPDGTNTVSVQTSHGAQLLAVPVTLK